MFSVQNIFSVTVTLFLVIDVLGSVPLIIAVKRNTGNLKPLVVTMFCGLLMIGFSLIGEDLLKALGIQVKAFAIAGAVVLLLLAIEMVSGIRIFRWEDEGESGNIVPIAFPIIVGVATLTTILSLRTRYSILDLIAGIVINMVIIYISLLSLTWLEKKLGNQALNLMKKFFGIILLALAVQTFLNNL